MSSFLYDFVPATLIAVTLLLCCVVFFYEVLAHIWLLLPRFEGRPRTQIILTVFSIFLAHTVCIWLFGVTYYVLDVYVDYGGVFGHHQSHFMDYIYFSGATYSSVGFCDIYPAGALRMITTLEVLMGLIMIGWSVTFTYLVTDKYLVHKRARHEAKRKESV